MPWKECNMIDERVKFVARLLEGKKMGAEIREFDLTTGACDMVVMVEARDDETMAKFGLTMGMGGNVRTTTLKAFPEHAYRKIIAGL
jgi:uncharacterized protein with GYD domain